MSLPMIWHLRHSFRFGHSHIQCKSHDTIKDKIQTVVHCCLTHMKRIHHHSLQSLELQYFEIHLNQPSAKLVWAMRHAGGLLNVITRNEEAWPNQEACDHDMGGLHSRKPELHISQNVDTRSSVTAAHELHDRERHVWSASLRHSNTQHAHAHNNARS